MSKLDNCPKCNVPIEWTDTDNPKIKDGKCPKCGLGFKKTGGTIISDVKFSR